MKGFYKRRADGELADMPPCGLCKHKDMWSLKVAPHFCCQQHPPVRIFGQGICYDSNTTSGFNYWKGDVNRERFVW